MRPLAAELAREGWAAWNVEYRRVGRGQGGGWPATFEDVAAAIDHIDRIDAQLDLARVVAIGHSAGGQLALWATARPGLPADAPGAGPRLRIGAVAALAAVSTMEDAARDDPGGAASAFLGGEPDEVPERYAVADPIRRVPLGARTLLVHGDADETVPPRRSRDYAAAARSAGDEVELVELPGAGHRELIDPRRSGWRAVADWLGPQRPAGFGGSDQRARS